MTSSRRHFVKIRSLSYLDNESSKINHIWYTSTSGQRSTKNVNKFRARTSTRTYARIKILKCSKFVSKLILHTFQAILSIFKICARVIMRARFRAYPRVLAFCNIESPNFFLLSYLLHFSKHFDTLFTFFRPVITQLAAVKVERTRRPALSVSTIHGQKHAYTKFILTLQNG